VGVRENEIKGGLHDPKLLVNTAYAEVHTCR
jgi:hypothetical protein